MCSKTLLLVFFFYWREFVSIPTCPVPTYMEREDFCSHPQELALECKCKITNKSLLRRHTFSMRLPPVLLFSIHGTQRSDLEVVVVKGEKKSSQKYLKSAQQSLYLKRLQRSVKEKKELRHFQNLRPNSVSGVCMWLTSAWRHRSFQWVARPR